MRIAIPLGPDDTQFKLNIAYTDYIAGAGYEPMTAIPHNDAMQMADFCDGLLLPGGKDIDPIFYGESNWGSFWADSAKDDFERIRRYAPPPDTMDCRLISRAKDAVGDKGLVTAVDGGYLTDLGRKAAEHAQALILILAPHQHSMAS